MDIFIRKIVRVVLTSSKSIIIIVSMNLNGMKRKTFPILIFVMLGQSKSNMPQTIKNDKNRIVREGT